MIKLLNRLLRTADPTLAPRSIVGAATEGSGYPLSVGYEMDRHEIEQILAAEGITHTWGWMVTAMHLGWSFYVPAGQAVDAERALKRYGATIHGRQLVGAIDAEVTP